MHIRLFPRHMHVPIVPRLFVIRRRADRSLFSTCTLLRQHHQQQQQQQQQQLTNTKFDILMTQIIDDPNTVRESLSRLREIHGEKEFKQKVTDDVLEHFKKSAYHMSLFQCLINSPELSRSVHVQLNKLIDQLNLTNQQRYEAVMEFLSLLNSIIPPNQFENPITLSNKIEDRILSITPRDRYKELFILLLNLNSHITDQSPMHKLIYALKTGTADEFFTFLNARLPYEEEPKHDPDLLMKNTYSYSMFADVLRVYNRLNNSPKFSKIISLMFQKIEEDNSARRPPKRLLISRVYDHLMSHVMGKYDLKPSLLILQDMQNNGIPISSRMLSILLNRLAMDSDLKNFAIFTNYILELYASRNAKLDLTGVQVITNQMLRIIQKSKFSHTDLKVIVGYTLTFFKESESILRNLDILPLVYDENTDIRLMKADVSMQLQVLKYPPITSLEQVYKALFRYMNYNKVMTLSTLKRLYFSLKDMVINVQHLERSDPRYKIHPFSYENMNDKILKLFMKQFLFRFSSFEGAADLLDDFTSEIHLKKLSNSYIFDMVINYYLRRGDAINAFRWFDKMTNEYDVKVNISVLVPLIVKSYELNSENSRNICSRLIKDYLAPSIRVNVYEPHLNQKLRIIIEDLELEYLFDMNLASEISETSSIPGRNVTTEFNLGNEFDDSLVDSFRNGIDIEDSLAGESAFMGPPVEEIEDDYKVFEMSDMESETEVKTELIEEDDDKVFEMSDMESETEVKTKTKNKNKTKLPFSSVPEIPKLVYDEQLDLKIHPPEKVFKERKEPVVVNTNEVIEEISALSEPSYERNVRQFETLFNKRQQFLQMLQSATNDDVMILLLKFLKNNDDNIIIYRTNREYKSFRGIKKAFTIKKKRLIRNV